jgi:hypothetical protein
VGLGIWDLHPGFYRFSALSVDFGAYMPIYRQLGSYFEVNVNAIADPRCPEPGISPFFWTQPHLCRFAIIWLF